MLFLCRAVVLLTFFILIQHKIEQITPCRFFALCIVLFISRKNSANYPSMIFCITHFTAAHHKCGSTGRGLRNTNGVAEISQNFAGTIVELVFSNKIVSPPLSRRFTDKPNCWEPIRRQLSFFATSLDWTDGKMSCCRSECRWNVWKTLHIWLCCCWQVMAGIVRGAVTDIVEETLSSSNSRFSNLAALLVSSDRAVFAAYDRLLDNRPVAVKCRLCSRDTSDRWGVRLSF